MDRLDEFAIFVRIVEEGSLVRAAQRLRRSAPAVTRALAALEDRIGVRLIDRTTRRLAPTEAGRALYERARAVVADYEAAAAGAREAPVRGLLRIAAPAGEDAALAKREEAAFYKGLAELSAQWRTAAAVDKPPE